MYEYEILFSEMVGCVSIGLGLGMVASFAGFGIASVIGIIKKSMGG